MPNRNKKTKSSDRNFLVGKKLALRGIEFEDLNGPYLRWMNDPEVTRYLESALFPNTRRRMENFLKSVDNAQNVMFCILDRKTGSHVGNVKLGPIQWIHRTSNFGILIGDKRFWGKGYATEATNLVLEYAFNKLNLNKVNLGFVAEHKAAAAVYKKLGFKIEGRTRQQFHSNGRYLDVIQMGLLKEEFKK